MGLEPRLRIMPSFIVVELLNVETSSKTKKRAVVEESQENCKPNRPVTRARPPIGGRISSLTQQSCLDPDSTTASAFWRPFSSSEVKQTRCEGNDIPYERSVFATDQWKGLLLGYGQSYSQCCRRWWAPLAVSRSQTSLALLVLCQRKCVPVRC